MSRGESFVDTVPATIKVGPYVYSVLKLDRLTDDNLGEWDDSTLQIRLKRSQPSATFALDTVLHEVSHAVWNLFALKNGGNEERVVSAMASGWAMVLADNPDLRKWIGDLCRS